MLNKTVQFLFFSLVIAAFLAVPAWPAAALGHAQPAGPTYLVQPGDSFSSIASRFGLTLQELIDANLDIDPNNLGIGDQVVIPGLEGITAMLITDPVQFGDSLASISRRNRIDPNYLIRLNHITSPSELFAGLGVVLPQDESILPLENRVSLRPGSSMLELAALSGANPYELLALNQLQGSWQALPSDVLYDQKPNPEALQNALPFSVTSLSISPIPVVQGGTVIITANTIAGTTLGGMLVDKPLHFFSSDDGNLIALQGVHAMLKPGPYPLRITATHADGSVDSFEQSIIVTSGYYPEDPILNVDPATIDPTIADPETNQLLQIVGQVNPEKGWEGIFTSPSYYNDCFTSRYGNRRTYVGIGSELTYNSFHSGLDFCGGTGLPITAPANGVVVFAGPLNVRGNATIIDHGWGVFSGIWHQDSISVEVGQSVTQGQQIGSVGGTGRVTGAHLHWEIWVNGVQVNPMEWLETSYP